MPKLIASSSTIKAPGEPPKLIQEFVGKVNSADQKVSIAKMTSPAGWTEPGQCPEFDEYTIVLKGCLQVRTESEIFEVRAGQAIHCKSGEWIQYSSPLEGGAEYVAVCLPAFSPETVHRDPA